MNKEVIDQLLEDEQLPLLKWVELIGNYDDNDIDYAQKLAQQVSNEYFGNKIYVRGLIEFSNYCKNDCYYCGIRRSNSDVKRYMLTEDDVLSCCQTGYELGFRTFVLQSGELNDDEIIISITKAIKKKYPDCAITLSIGEKSRLVYEKFFNAGADRYLLRHETVTENHYGQLHPNNMFLEKRLNCLKDLKEIGFQVGCGIMVGSPYQTIENLANDMMYISEFKPQMVGMGPFLPHSNTPFKDMPPGSFELTLFLLSLTRIMLKNVLLPSTTALGTIHPMGREKGILAGANVVMPNLSPKEVRDKYTLYNNKISSGEEAAESIKLLADKMASIGYELVSERGDWRPSKLRTVKK